MLVPDLYHKLLRLGLQPNYQTDSLLQKIQATTVREGEAAFIICFTGYNEQMVYIAKQLRKREAFTVVPKIFFRPTAAH